MAKPGSIFKILTALTVVGGLIILFEIFNTSLRASGSLNKIGPLISWKGSPKGDMKFRVMPANSTARKSQCPTSLEKKALEFQWFRDRYQRDIQLLINKDLMTEREFSRLRRYFMPFGYRHTNIKGLKKLSYRDLMRILNRLPSTNSIFWKPGVKSNLSMEPLCASCAVVGNGGILNGSNRGHEIDQYDYVFRMNNYAKGHEKDIGTKHTHWVIYDRSFSKTNITDLPNFQNTTFLFLPCSLADYLYLKNLINNKVDVKGKKYYPMFAINPQRIFLIHPDFFRYIKKVWLKSRKKYRPSTGAIALLIALHSGRCDRIGIYGFGRTTNYSYYYYDKKFVKIGLHHPSHDFKAELELMKNLHRDGIAYFDQRELISKDSLK